MLTTDERIQAEKIFWRNAERILCSESQAFHWEKSGCEIERKTMQKAIVQFHHDPGTYGFYGMAMELGEWNGFTVSLMIEVQEEIVLGLQVREKVEQYEDRHHAAFSDLLVTLSQAVPKWHFDAIGLLAWRLPQVRFNFRDDRQRSVIDLFCFQEDSEAWIRFEEEIKDLVKDFSSVFATYQIKHQYDGTFIA